jgi:hypothetical protein
MLISNKFVSVLWETEFSFYWLLVLFVNILLESRSRLPW